MKRRICSALLVLLPAFLALGLAGPAARADTDVVGGTSADQSAATATEVDTSADSPTPVSGNGSPPGTYSTDIAEADELLSDRDVAVITSSQPGTAALTGVAIDGASGAPVAGAAASLRPSEGGSSVTARSDADGVFAFINVPAGASGARYTMTVTAPGHGTYTLLNDLYEPDSTYEMVVALGAAPQTFDEADLVPEEAQGATGGSSGYTATKRVPPIITVGIFQQVDGCHTGDFVRTERYPWRFYVLHVAAGEINTLWHQVAWKANAAAEQNYAWWFRIHPASSSYDIGNTSAWQCFRPERKIPTDWSKWLKDVVDERIVTAGDDIQQTQYRAGSYDCSESEYPADGNKLSQNGSRALDNDCGYQNWRSIDEYYYTGDVVAAIPPPQPNTSFGKPHGGVKLNYPSQVKAGGRVSNVGWTYTVEARKLQPDNTYAWTVIHVNGWGPGSRTVPTTFTYSTGGCWRYRAKAANPAGVSTYAGYNGGNPICPG